MFPRRLAPCFALVLACWAVAFVPAADPAADAPLRIHMIAFGEYNPIKSFTEFKDFLEKNYRVTVTTSFSQSGSKLEGLDDLPKAELLLLFARRMQLKEDQMKVIRAHWEQGKPVIGIRTASHAFQKDDNEVFDQKVLGGNYAGTGGGKVLVSPAAADHPVLKGVQPFKPSQSLYGQGKLADDVVVLQVQGSTPQTWAHTYKGGRTLYTSAGAPDDFKDENFRRLLANAVFWTTQRDPEKMKK